MDQNGQRSTERDEVPREERGAGLGERGAGLVEYALLLALIAIVCIAALNAMGDTNSGSIRGTADKYASATG